MSESKKLMIGFAIMSVICCCLAGVGFLGLREFGNRVENMTNGEPTSVAQVQGKIAEFDVPPGYEPKAMSMILYDIVTLTPSKTDGPMIILMQYSTLNSLSQEQVEEQLRRTAEQQGSQPGMSMRVVDSFQKVIRGESVTVTVSEANYEGFTIRQWMTIFQGNKGPVILMIQGPTASWNDELIENFIQSIR